MSKHKKKLMKKQTKEFIKAQRVMQTMLGAVLLLASVVLFPLSIVYFGNSIAGAIMCGSNLLLMVGWAKYIMDVNRPVE